MGIGRNPSSKAMESTNSTDGKYEEETKHSAFFSLPVGINGGAASSGDQDTEDTELMAIYTTESGIAEKGNICLASIFATILNCVYLVNYGLGYNGDYVGW